MTATERGSHDRGSPAAAEVSTDHRAHLDGMRALAVYLVVLYHAGLDRVAGGFVGVDVFFVLSGYLVTLLLLRDLREHGGVRLRRFYARRYRRLLPAAFVVLMASAVGLTMVGTAAEVSSATGGFRASFLYVANWHFIGQAADYFAADVNENPVVHFWSLAVEEQFYLVWPLLLVGALWLTRRAARPLRWVRAAVVVGGAVSALAALHLAPGDLSRAYYGTDTRAYELLAGAALALTPRLVALAAARARIAQGLAVVAAASVVLLAVSLRTLDPVERGVWVTVAAVLLIVAVEASTPSGLVRRALAAGPAAYLGRVSYGTYLWHWPLIFLLRKEVVLTPGQLAGVACVGATALAVVSFHGLEMPVRVSSLLDRHRTAVIAAGLAISLVSGLALAPAVLGTKSSEAAIVDWRAAARDNPPLPDCRPGAIERCTVVEGDGLHILLLGDSNARMFIPTFTEIAQREGLRLSVASRRLCPWQRGLFYLVGGPECQTARTFWYDELVAALDPDVIVLGDRPMDDPANPVELFGPTGRVALGSASFDDALVVTTDQSLDQLGVPGRTIVLLEPIPIATKAADPLSCLSSATAVADCQYRATRGPTPLERHYRTRALPGSGIVSLDVDRLVCPRLPVCDAVVDGLVVKRDSDHITGTFARHLADPVAELLHRNGVLGG